MKKRANNALLKIVAATSVTIFSLFAVFTGSLAWFQTIKQQRDTADTMRVNDLAGKFKQMTFHNLADNGKTISTNEAQCSFKFNKTAAGTISYNWSTKQFNNTGTTSIALNPYETLDRYQPILLLIEFQQEYQDLGAGDAVISATVNHVDGKGFIGARNATTNSPEYDLSNSNIYQTINNKNYYWLSSVIRFFSKSFDASSFSTLSSGSTYDFTLGNMDNQSHFVSINSSNETSSFTESIDIYSSPADTDIQYIAVIVDYFPDAVEFIYSTFLGDATLESAEYDYELNYLCDWKMEVR